jgi:TPP-dependent pyruvate/acetoin dehydrogenase alpha subunit
MTTASTQTTTRAGAAPPHNGFSLISNDKLLQLYSTMLRCRMLEQRIRLLSKQNGHAEPYAAESREAAAVGIGVDLLPSDTVAPSPRGFIPSFVKGLPVSRIFSALSAGPVRGRSSYAQLKLIPPSLSLRAQLDRAITAAKTNKASKNKKIVVAFCGSSSAAPDLLHQAMHRAGKLRLPILLVCHSDLDGEDICLKAESYGFPGVVVDRDDAVAAYRVATEAIAHARRGSGPTLIDCRPWPHSGAKSGKRHAARSPVLNMERYLVRKGLFDKKFKSKVTANFRRELDLAIKGN